MPHGRLDERGGNGLTAAAALAVVGDPVRPLLGTHEELLTCSELYRDLVGNW